MVVLPKPKRERSEARLDFVRRKGCLICVFSHILLIAGHVKACGQCEAHHVRKGSGSGVGTKPSDFRTVPLCATGHAEYHKIGHAAFCAKYGLDLEAHIERINAEFALTQKQKPKPREPRRKSPGLKFITVQCPCGRVEKIPAGKLSRYGTGLRYRCLRTGSVESVRIAG